MLNRGARLGPYEIQTPDLAAWARSTSARDSSLTHPHICAVYDVWQRGRRGLPLMEHSCETLAQRSLRGALPLEDVLRIGPNSPMR